MKPVTAALLFCSLAALGCGSGDTANAKPITLHSIDAVCRRDSPSASLTSVAPTARALLALVQPSYHLTYVPSDPSLPSTPVTVTVAYWSGAISCGPVLCVCDPPGPCGGACEPPHLIVGVDMTFRTADGEFDEAFSGTLEAKSSDGPVIVDGRLPGTALKGTYVPKMGARADISVDFSLLVDGSNLVNGAVQEGPTQGGPSGGGGVLE